MLQRQDVIAEWARANFSKPVKLRGFDLAFLVVPIGVLLAGVALIEITGKISDIVDKLQSGMTFDPWSINLIDLALLIGGACMITWSLKVRGIRGVYLDAEIVRTRDGSEYQWSDLKGIYWGKGLTVNMRRTFTNRAELYFDEGKVMIPLLFNQEVCSILAGSPVDQRQ